MSYEEERLNILRRVSAGELSPQEGSLQIAMLKVHQQEAPSGAQSSADLAFEEAPQDARRPPWPQMPPWPFMLLLLVPFLSIALILASALALVLALPTLLVVAVWNALASAWPGMMPSLSFLPTLALMMALALLWMLVGRRRFV